MFAPLGALSALGKGFTDAEPADKFFDQLGMAALGRTFQQPQEQQQTPMPGQPSMPSPPPMPPPQQMPPQQPMPPQGSPQARINDSFGAMGMSPAQAPSPSPGGGPAGAPPPSVPTIGGGGGPEPMQRGVTLDVLAGRIRQANPDLPPRALYSAMLHGQQLLNPAGRAQLQDVGRRMYGLPPQQRAMPQMKFGGSKSFLKPGHVTTFRNGSKWTLDESGQPQLVAGGEESLAAGQQYANVEPSDFSPSDNFRSRAVGMGHEEVGRFDRPPISQEWMEPQLPTNVAPIGGGRATPRELPAGRGRPLPPKPEERYYRDRSRPPENPGIWDIPTGNIGDAGGDDPMTAQAQAWPAPRGQSFAQAPGMGGEYDPKYPPGWPSSTRGYPATETYKLHPERFVGARGYMEGHGDLPGTLKEFRDEYRREPKPGEESDTYMRDNRDLIDAEKNRVQLGLAQALKNYGLDLPVGDPPPVNNNKKETRVNRIIDLPLPYDKPLLPDTSQFYQRGRPFPPTIKEFIKKFGRKPITDSEVEFYYPDQNSSRRSDDRAQAPDPSGRDMDFMRRGSNRSEPGFRAMPPTVEGFIRKYGREPGTDAELEHYYPDVGAADDDRERGKPRSRSGTVRNASPRREPPAAPYPYDLQTPESFRDASKSVRPGKDEPYFLPNTVEEFQQTYGRLPRRGEEQNFYRENPAAAARESARPQLSHEELTRLLNDFIRHDDANENYPARIADFVQKYGREPGTDSEMERYYGVPGDLTLDAGRYKRGTDRHTIDLHSILDYKRGMRGQRTPSLPATVDRVRPQR